MLHQRMVLFAIGILLFGVAPLFGEGNTTASDECILTDIESRLSIASEIIETVKQKIPRDLKELCRTLNIIEGKNVAHDLKPMDCSDIYKNGHRKDGVYEIWPLRRMSEGPLRVYCDMESNGGGWTVLQRRGDYKRPEDYFYRDWSDYKIGFGDIQKDFWIGNDNLYVLTNQRFYQLRVNLSDWEGNTTYATYDELRIADEQHKYTLLVKGYNGTAGNSLGPHNGMGFYTKDRDNKNGCAVKRKGAWWYDNCSHSNLNGLYLRGQTNRKTEMDMVWWNTFRGLTYSLKGTVMKIRPSGFEAKASD